jgi:hypothetical protein
MQVLSTASRTMVLGQRNSRNKNSVDMKVNYTKIIVFLFGLIWLIVAITLLSGCSANYHFNKFIKKGGTIDTTERIVSVEKVIKVNGKDSIIFVLMPLNCPEIQIPPTRYETRLEYRLKRDSFETVRYLTKWKTKEVVKLAKVQKVKERNPFNWFWIGLGIGLILPILFRFVIKRL